MILKAIVRLQPHKSRHDKLVFVPKGMDECGVKGAGEVKRYEITARSWNQLRVLLKQFSVLASTKAKPETVEAYVSVNGDCERGRVALAEVIE